jgi:hypothetical protein
MSTPDQSGPAFPVHSSYIATGITLRDCFALSALCGIEASQGNGGHFVSTPEKVAERAYQLADAMLKERGQS